MADDQYAVAVFMRETGRCVFVSALEDLAGARRLLDALVALGEPEPARIVGAAEAREIKRTMANGGVRW